MPDHSDDLQFDRLHLWHPYTSAADPLPCYPVASTEGNRIVLADGRRLIDGMASWWCAIHGYNHPVLVEAIRRQADVMPHVMFGGLTHQPAIDLGRLLLEITPGQMSHVFFADSGSVSVEVAIKMAVQYQRATGNTQKTSILALRGGYHGDTVGAMSVTDPDGAMHSEFAGLLPRQYFAPRPARRFGESVGEDDENMADITRTIKENAPRLAAVILEPIVQGAGGMWFYAADYLRRIREICDRHDVLLIFDEIATGFGRTGKLFAAEHADVAPDIMCVGKALTGGMMTLAATMATERVARGASSTGLPLMHGPTFMANPLACSTAIVSTELLLSSDWSAAVARIEQRMREGLAPAADSNTVADVRVLGGIGVIETHRPIDVAAMQRFFVDSGVWIRPFGRLLYIMPPYTTDDTDIDTLCKAMIAAIRREELLK